MVLGEDSVRAQLIEVGLLLLTVVRVTRSLSLTAELYITMKCLLGANFLISAWVRGYLSQGYSLGMTFRAPDIPDQFLSRFFL